MSEKDFQLKEYVQIDGHQHGMIIEGQNKENPVVLFLHGGPGFPAYPMIKASRLEWTKFVTICYWDQRGAGMSFNSKTQGPLTVERYIKDTLAITEYVKEKLNKEKIYLMGHSWGSFLGSLVACKYPEHYSAYIGMGQLGRFKESNQETIQFLLETAITRGDQKAEKMVGDIVFDENFYVNRDYQKVLSRYLMKYGGGMKRKNYSMSQVLKEVFRCKPYTWKEKFNIPRGSLLSYQAVGETLAKTDLAKRTPRFEIPVYILQGAYDYQTTCNEAKRFYENIEAPDKQFFLFEDCAHTPFVEDQNRFIDILINRILVEPSAVVGS
ncbi:alpha/beta hydrolase [Allobacillus sp. GCM10007491]|nr:alpha/beta hydrolase [Allobacillus saliphilus]